MIEKKSIYDLAVFDGQPTFETPLHVGRPNVGDRQRFMQYMEDLLDRRWFTNKGPYVLELEQKIAALLGVRHCIMMCNGTVALEIAIRACGITGEVILPSFTFIATAHALQWQEITPVFCDIDPKTHCIDPACVERHITPRTSAIIGVHLWGNACDVEALQEISERHNLKLLFDAAHAFNCSYRGRMIGGFGDAEIFSFHATKFFTTFEGGAVTTNDDDLAEKIRLMKNFGFAGQDNVIYIGTNGKMSEASAAMGLAALESLDRFVEINRRNYLQYHEALADLKGLRLYRYNEAETCNFQYVIVEVDEVECGLSRDQLQTLLLAEKVLARRYFYPGCHRMEPYRSYFPHVGMLLPETERLSHRVLALPTGTAVGEEEIDQICRLIGFALSKGEDIRREFLEREIPTDRLRIRAV